jgi:hypothetical protein
MHTEIKGLRVRLRVWIQEIKGLRFRLRIWIQRLRV